jgi:hypothetical protein
VERSADRDGVQAHLDGCPDEPGLEAEVLDLPQSGAAPLEPSVWGASGGAHRVEAVGAAHPHHQEPPEDAGAGKLADLAQDVQERGALFPQVIPRTQREPGGAEAPYTPDVAQFVARSCVAQAALAQPRQVERPGAVQQAQAEVRVTRELSPTALQAEPGSPLQQEAQAEPLDVGARQPVPAEQRA